MSGGLINCPIVNSRPGQRRPRMSAPRTAHTFENMLAHIPGLKVGRPGHPIRLPKALLKTAIRDNDPRHVPRKHGALRHER